VLPSLSGRLALTLALLTKPAPWRGIAPKNSPDALKAWTRPVREQWAFPRFSFMRRSRTGCSPARFRGEFSRQWKDSERLGRLSGRPPTSHPKPSLGPEPLVPGTGLLRREWEFLCPIRVLYTPGSRILVTSSEALDPSRTPSTKYHAYNVLHGSGPPEKGPESLVFGVA
jgi:hypothetical protein